MPLVNLNLPADLGGLFPNPQPPAASPPAAPGGMWMLMPVQAQFPGAAADATSSRAANPVSTEPPPTTPPTGDRLFTRHGPSRAIRVGAQQVLVRDRKGHRYLEHLLRRPFTSVAAITLKAADDGCDPAVFRGSLGTTISRESLDDLRERYRELVGELEEARAHGATIRQEAIARELERIASDCQRVTRPGNRLREQSDAEKVRIAVTNAVRRGIWAIEQASPEIAAYFKRTVVTGHWLMFRPIADEVWQV